MKKIFNALLIFLYIIYSSWVYVLKELKDFLYFKYLNFKFKYSKRNKIKPTQNFLPHYKETKEVTQPTENVERVANLPAVMPIITILPNSVEIKGGRNFYKSFLLIALQGFLISIVGFLLVILYVVWDSPDYRSIETYEPPLSTRLYASDGALISEFSNEKRLLVPINDIPEYVKEAFISAEDKNFYKHYGFDFIAIIRATINNIRYFTGFSKNLEGASTISQQVAKNFFLDSRRTLLRKLKEAYITIQIERMYPKEYILELYLNEIYLGRGSYGVATAALNYFNKTISQLTIEEAAFLAAIPKAPSRYDPKFNYALSKERRDWVILRMLEDNKISATLAYERIAKPINFVDTNIAQPYSPINNYATEEVRKDLLKKFSNSDIYNGGLIIKTTINNTYQQYAYNVLRAGLEKFDTQLGYRAPFYRYNENYNYNTTQLQSKQFKNTPMWLTMLRDNGLVNKYKYTIDPWRLGIVVSIDKDRLQVGLLTGELVEVNLLYNEWVKPVGSTKKVDFDLVFKVSDIIFLEKNNQENWLIKQIPEVNGAIMVLNIHTGDVLAMQGGYSFTFSEFNRATQAYRQPGSSFKPFVYLAAIVKGATPADTVLDAPYISDEGSTVWRPKNDGNSYRGYITLRQALERSVNLATIRVAESVGLSNISSLVQKLGVYNDNLDNLSQILGSKETTLARMLTAYSIIANGGKLISPNLVHLVQDRFGKTIYKKDNISCKGCNDLNWTGQLPEELNIEREQIIDPKDAYIVSNMMKGVIERGTGRAVKIDQYDIAGKTGTTNSVKDTWFIAFTADIAVGVYFGYDTPRSLGDRLSSVSVALPIIKNFFTEIIKSYTPQPFRTPNGIEMRWVNYQNGEPSRSGQEGAILESFKQGSDNKSNIINKDKDSEVNSNDDVNIIY